jgi:CRP-like cAMP-binding protein
VRAEVYILVEGDADVRFGADGHVVGTVGPGAFLGEVAALAERPRTASVIAQGDVGTLSRSRDLFLDLIKERPGAEPVLAARHDDARHDIGR